LKLYEAAKLIRSKNAGPFTLTIDILFENVQIYSQVKNSRKITSGLIANMYGLPVQKIKIYECDDALAIKISFPRLVSSGGIGDYDVFGGQQHGPLVELEI
jgi:hypothetical protein